MLLSSVSPLPGCSMNEVIKSLRLITTDLRNIGSGPAAEVLEDYQQWSNAAAETLGYTFAGDDIERLILTKRHWVLLSLDPAGNGPVVHDLIRVERTDRLRALTAATHELEDIERTWSEVSAKVVAADTNVYLHHEQYFDSIDWHELAGSENVRLLVPLEVVRELDRNKHAGKNITVSTANREPIRTRARVTIRKLRELFQEPGSKITLHEGVEVELLRDPIGHRALDDPDTEIIDRVMTAQTLTGQPVAIVTDDGGMQFSARTAGVDVIPLWDRTNG